MINHRFRMSPLYQFQNHNTHQNSDALILVQTNQQGRLTK